MRDLNPRPLACEASALPTELIAQKTAKERFRTTVMARGHVVAASSASVMGSVQFSSAVA